MGSSQLVPLHIWQPSPGVSYTAPGLHTYPHLLTVSLQGTAGLHLSLYGLPGSPERVPGSLQDTSAHFLSSCCPADPPVLAEAPSL